MDRHRQAGGSGWKPSGALKRRLSEVVYVRHEPTCQPERLPPGRLVEELKRLRLGLPSRVVELAG